MPDTPRAAWHWRALLVKLQQALCRHQYWAYMGDDGLTTVQKCGRCGRKHPCT